MSIYHENPSINENFGVEKPVEFFIPPRPWVRYFARLIDIYFGSFTVAIIWNIVSPSTYDKILVNIGNKYFIGIILYIIWLFFESFLLSTLGTTPGKWTFSSKLVSIDGGKLSFSKALLRSFSMWVNGLGLMLPVVSLITLTNSFNRLKNENYTGHTKWDIKTNSAVITTKLNPIKIVLLIIICIVSLVGYDYYNVNQEETVNVNNVAVQQLNDTRVNLDKEKAFLDNWKNELTIQLDNLNELSDDMEALSGNETDYDSTIDNYNSDVDNYNLQQTKFETRRLKYNSDTDIYNKKYEELIGSEE